MNLDIDQILELDRLNMTAIIAEAGDKFDPERRRAALLAEIGDDAAFILIRRSGRLVAYVEYIPQHDNSWKVASIQIHPKNSNGIIMRPILSQAYDRLKSGCPSAIKSSVHINNEASVRLHTRLGFKETTRTDERILFEISGKNLLDNIAVFLKK